MKKRGSHVGVVISFVIFIIFLVFVYAILQPALKRQKGEEAVLEHLKTKFVGNFSMNLTSVGLKADTDESGCIEFENFQEDAELDNLRVVVKNEQQNNPVSYKRSLNLIIVRESITNKFFKVYHSENFAGLEDWTGGDCEELEYPQDYEFGLTRTKEYVFESQVFELIDYYENNYENLKQEFEIPESNDFGFSFELVNGTIIGTVEEDLSVNIYVQEFPMQYVDRQANINYGYLNVRVW